MHEQTYIRFTKFLLEMLHSESEDTMFLLKVWKYSLNNAVSHPRRIGSSAKTPWDTQILHILTHFSLVSVRHGIAVLQV